MSGLDSKPESAPLQDDKLTAGIRRFITWSATIEQAKKQRLDPKWGNTHPPRPPGPPSEPLSGWRKYVALSIAWLIIMAFLGMIGFGVYLWIRPRPHRADRVESRIVVFKEILTLDKALSWRRTYGDLLGKDRTDAVRRFGPPNWQSDDELKWKPSHETFGRQVLLTLSKSSISSVEITPKPTEALDFSEIMEHGGFSFEAIPFDDPDGKRSYDVKVISKDGHCEMRFTLDGVMFFETVKFK